MVCYLSIGSNLGERVNNLTVAIQKLKKHPRLKVLRVSRVYETEPLEKYDQPDFLNVAVEIETDLGPLELLRELKTIESEMGRIQSERWGPRVIDLDIIFYGDLRYSDSQLTIPHMRYRTRRFVLLPLADLCKDKKDPLTGMTVAELLESPTAEGKAVATDIVLAP